MPWLVYERRYDGQYKPALYHGEKPTRKAQGRAERHFMADPTWVEATTLDGALYEIKVKEIREGMK